MKRRAKTWTPLLLAGMLIVSACFLTSCARKIVVIPEDRMIRALPNGNYEVTPAWLQDRYRLEMEMKQALEECKGGK